MIELLIWTACTFGQVQFINETDRPAIVTIITESTENSPPTQEQAIIEAEGVLPWAVKSSTLTWMLDGEEYTTQCFNTFFPTIQ